MNKDLEERMVALSMEEAQRSIASGDPPFGAVLTDEAGTVIATAHNTVNSQHDPTAHAEISVLREAGTKLGTVSFPGYRLFTNAEPCPMCMSAAIKARIVHFYFGAPREELGVPAFSAEEVAARAKEEIHLEGGILEDTCREQIQKGRGLLH